MINIQLDESVAILLIFLIGVAFGIFLGSVI